MTQSEPCQRTDEAGRKAGIERKQCRPTGGVVVEAIQALWRDGKRRVVAHLGQRVIDERFNQALKYGNRNDPMSGGAKAMGSDLENRK